MGAVGSALSAIAGGCGCGDGMPAAQGKHDKPVKTDPIRRFIGGLGPGLITGASDDDPSGIGTYSQAGAQLGFSIGWTMLLTYPLMVAIQEISARLGHPRHHDFAVPVLLASLAGGGRR
jgi:hypothetical protein